MKDDYLIVRVSKEFKRKFLDECKTRYEVPIEYSSLIRKWIENWVERGNPSKDKEVN